MRLHEFIQVHNCIINGYSLIDNVFGSTFVVYDESGQMYTTGRNVKLLRRAQSVLEDQSFDSQGAMSAVLAKLREEADVLTADCYQKSITRESRISRGDSDLRRSDFLR